MVVLRHAWAHFTLIGVVFFLSLLFSLPNLYPEKPAVTVHASSPEALRSAARILLDDQAFRVFGPKCSSSTDSSFVCVFPTVDAQMQAKEYLQAKLGADFSLSLALRDSTPSWMQHLGLAPMKLGLDLRGGVHLLVNVDTSQLLKSDGTASFKEILGQLRNIGIAYTQVNLSQDNLSLSVQKHALDKTKELLNQQFSQFAFDLQDNRFKISSKSESQEGKIRYVVDKTLESIEKRVNELGLSEAIVQKHGNNQISIDLPGIQDIQHAKSILGNTSTLSFQLVHASVPRDTPTAQLVQYGAEQVYDDQGRPLIVHTDSVLSGDAITYATASSQEAKPVVQIQLGGGGEERFYQSTKANVGRQLAIVLVESKAEEDGTRAYTKRIISAPVIQQPLRNAFVITGLRSYEESETLSLLLRSGSLAAPVDIVEEMTIGPSMGAENIQKGLFSIAIGFIAIMSFMVIYYNLFGWIANAALLLNLFCIMCLLSWLSATLTLPAMAAIVLTVGMAVDANVLINERIREELRMGASPATSLVSGYDKAIATIYDANITTLIVSLVLFGLSSGMIKGFAVTLIIGILASVFTSVYVTRIISMTVFHRMGDLSKAIGM